MANPTRQSGQLIADTKRKMNKHTKEVMLVSTFFLLLFLSLFYLQPSFTGSIVQEQQLNYSENLNLEFADSSNYVWEPDNIGELRNLELSGIITSGTNAKVYLENNGLTYLVLDTSQLDKSGLPSITGLVVLNETNNTINKTTSINKTITNETNETLTINQTLINETTPITNQTTPITNQSLENQTLVNQTTITKTITSSLTYQDNSAFDQNNDGIETTTGVIDFKLNSNFNWNVDHNKLCTKYEIYSEENQTSTLTCYGSTQCCSLVDLTPEKDSWNETLYLNLGKYDSTSNNLVSSQTIYANYSLAVENPYSEIITSNSNILSAKFLENQIPFNNICIDTCLLSNLNSPSYNLIINITNGSINLNKIDYSIIETIQNIAENLTQDTITTKETVTNGKPEKWIKKIKLK
ncbi:MAG: hypothetical protein QF824_00855 [Candidatus Woesearchaeota archaeon]|nr:hypothetical protein [Candidatus Woesearchaeota archaeon]